MRSWVFCSNPQRCNPPQTQPPNIPKGTFEWFLEKVRKRNGCGVYVPVCTRWGGVGWQSWLKNPSANGLPSGWGPRGGFGFILVQVLEIGQFVKHSESKVGGGECRGNSHSAWPHVASALEGGVGSEDEEGREKKV